VLQGGCLEKCVLIPCRGNNLNPICNIPIGLTLIMSVSIFSHNQEIILLSRPDWGPTQCPVQWLLREMHMECEVDSSPPPRAEVKAWSFTSVLTSVFIG
jgi:hypothetical protein